jgi:hypothetical protein
MMKQVRMVVAAVAVLCVFLPVAARAEMPRSEIRINNDTQTQISFKITTQKNGTMNFTWSPGAKLYPTSNKVRVRVKGDDMIQIADWGRTRIDQVAVFDNGVWILSLGQARGRLQHSSSGGYRQPHQQNRPLRALKNPAYFEDVGRRIRVTNDTSSTVTFVIRHANGYKYNWTWNPGKSAILYDNQRGIELDVTGGDVVFIKGQQKSAYFKNVAYLDQNASPSMWDLRISELYQATR